MTNTEDGWPTADDELFDLLVDGGDRKMGDTDHALAYLKFRLDVPGKPVGLRLRITNAGNPTGDSGRICRVAGPWDEVRKQGRVFASTHGDGTLAQPAGWGGLGQRGGAMDSRAVSISHRIGHGYGTSGSRCVRTAP